jgi:hypothetical protein
MTIDFLPYTNEQILSDAGLQCTDIYQTLPYLTVEARRSGSNPYILVYRSRRFHAALPVLVSETPYREITKNKLYDAASPYGYPGIIYRDTPSTDELTEFFNLLSACAAQNNLVSVFIRLHPLYNQELAVHTQNINTTMHGRTVYVDLAQPADITEKQFSKNHQRGIKTLQKNGYSIKINHMQDYPLFILAYQQTMQRAGAASFYFFDDAYFEHLKTALGDKLVLISAYDPDGNFASGALFTIYGEIAQYHLGGTIEESRDAAPSKFVFNSAIEYFRAAHCRYLHLGGGVGSAEDELFRFKLGFAKSTWQYSTIRCITQPETYEQLVAAHREKTSLSGSNYFPLYRQP